MRTVIGKVLWCEVYDTTATYTTVKDLQKGCWFTFTASQTGLYIRPYKSGGIWDYLKEGVYIERGDKVSYVLPDGEFSYYIPTGGILRVEQVDPIDPYETR